MARHALQAELRHFIGSFGDSVKHYFFTRIKIIKFLQYVIYVVLFYPIFFSGFTAPRPSHFSNAFPREFPDRVRRASFIKMIANLAVLAKACNKVK